MTEVGASFGGLGVVWVLQTGVSDLGFEVQAPREFGASYHFEV